MLAWRAIRRRIHGLLGVVLAVTLSGAAGCELVLRFDRDRIEDSGVRLDGEVVGDDEK